MAEVGDNSEMLAFWGTYGERWRSLEKLCRTLNFDACYCIRIKRKVGIGVLRNRWEEIELFRESHRRPWERGLVGTAFFLNYAAPKPCMLVTVAMLGKEKLPLLCRGTHGSIWSSWEGLKRKKSQDTCEKEKDGHSFLLMPNPQVICLLLWQN